MNNKEKIYIELLENGKIPYYASKDSAGADLFAGEDIVIKPFETKVVPLNIKIALPSHLEAQIRPRSGLSLKTDMRVTNSPGTIDADYRDIVGVIIQNTFSFGMMSNMAALNPKILEEIENNSKSISMIEYWKYHNIQEPNIKNKTLYEELCKSNILVDKDMNPYGTIYIKKGDRIAQMVVSEYIQADFEKVDSVANIGNNRGGGYGHTGVNSDSVLDGQTTLPF